MKPAETVWSHLSRRRSRVRVPSLVRLRSKRYAQMTGKLATHRRVVAKVVELESYDSSPMASFEDEVRQNLRAWRERPGAAGR